jgi:hypothetical protein
MDSHVHLVIGNAVDPDMFAQLATAFPVDDLIVNGRQVKD